MAKTKPIGVRFDLGLLERLKKEKQIETPQGALNFLSELYINVDRKEEPKSISSSIKRYDYSKMPKGLTSIQQMVWKQKAKEEQDKK
jgi:predicted ATPase